MPPLGQLHPIYYNGLSNTTFFGMKGLKGGKVRTGRLITQIDEKFSDIGFRFSQTREKQSDRQTLALGMCKV